MLQLEDQKKKYCSTAFNQQRALKYEGGGVFRAESREVPWSGERDVTVSSSG